MTPGSRLRRLVSRLSVRLLVTNLVLVAVPIGGFFFLGLRQYLGFYEEQLLDAQERSMAQQARLLAAALAQSPPPAAGDGVPGTLAGLDDEAAERILNEMNQQFTARLRVVDPSGVVLADSSRLGPRRSPEAVEGARLDTVDDAAAARESWMYRLGAAPFRWLRRDAPPDPTTPERPGGPGAEIESALAGIYGTAIRATPGQRGLTLAIAVPVRRGERIVGAVAASQSTLRILEQVDRLRLSLFRVFLVSLAVAVALSLLLATTISRPLARLRREAAALIDRRGRLAGSFSRSGQLDEIGDLARTLESLTERIDHHVQFVEAFAADVSHEFKNPLAAIRGATEMLGEVDDDVERQRFLGIIGREVARMEHLLAGVREITHIDSQLEREPVRPLELGRWLESLVAGVRQRAERGVRLLYLPPAGDLTVSVSPERLAQAFENLLDNALSFAPAGSEVTVALGADPDPANDDVVVTVTDRGPGIPAEHLERVFDRFFTYRPQDPDARRRHTGLGLAIVRAVVEAYGGQVTAAAQPAGGARFTVRLPRAGAAPGKVG